MFQLLSIGILPLWLTVIGVFAESPQPPLTTLDILLNNSPDPTVAKVLDNYLGKINQQGFPPTQQGLWLQTHHSLLAHHHGRQPLPAASLTKVATSLAALKTWPPHYQFVTEVRTTGKIIKGKLIGDLIMVGGGDPLFVGREAISLGHRLNQLGIRQVSGNLVIQGPFTMDFQADVNQSGQRLRQGLNGQVLLPSQDNLYTQPIHAAPLKPSLQIDGDVITSGQPPAHTKLLLRHYSLPLYALLKQMNVNSNNALAEALTQSMGGTKHLVQRVREATDLPAAELLLQNGSGLGSDNRLSPRAVTALFMGIQQALHPHNLTLADLFPVAALDMGTLTDRSLPPTVIVKTGTLWNVSALAGVIPSQRFGPVWFTIINGGDNVQGFRQGQDQFLQKLAHRWGTAPLTSLKPTQTMPMIGDPHRHISHDSLRD